MKNPVNEWNKKHKVGSQVTYTDVEGKKHITKTTHRAWLLGGSMPVIKVEYQPDFCVGLEDVKANIPADEGCLI